VSLTDTKTNKTEGCYFVAYLLADNRTSKTKAVLHVAGAGVTNRIYRGATTNK